MLESVRISANLLQLWPIMIRNVFHFWQKDYISRVQLHNCTALLQRCRVSVKWCRQVQQRPMHKRLRYC